MRDQLATPPLSVSRDCSADRTTPQEIANIAAPVPTLVHGARKKHSNKNATAAQDDLNSAVLPLFVPSGNMTFLNYYIFLQRYVHVFFTQKVE